MKANKTDCVTEPGFLGALQYIRGNGMHVDDDQLFIDTDLDVQQIKEVLRSFNYGMGMFVFVFRFCFCLYVYQRKVTPVDETKM